MPAVLPQQVRNFIQRHNLIRPGTHVLVAVSGGADSVALLNALHELSRPLKLRLTIAHLNHKIRGKDACNDAFFVRKLARRLHLDFMGGTADIPRMAGRLGVSLEMAGRRARYDFLKKTAKARRCDIVATAHTSDDSIESMLIMMIRGCGSQGLTGITPLLRMGTINVVRPLLETSRKEIEKYLRGRNLKWREDISNADHAFLRNRVRHELLPLLEAKYNKGIRNALARLADLLRGENKLLDTLTAAIYAETYDEFDHSLDCSVMAKYPLAARRRILRHWLKENAVNAVASDYPAINKLDSMLMNAAAGRSLALAGGIIVRRIDRRIKIEHTRRAEPDQYLVQIKTSGRTVLPAAGLVARANTATGFRREREILGKFPARAWLSLNKWRRRKITARAWRPGDRMHPFGLKGTKKIQDIFSDAKLPANMRRCLPIFECGGEIIWIPGYRIAEGWQVANFTDKSLHLTLGRECRK
jgi:tRNA(Ile)-lysidine synthase